MVRTSFEDIAALVLDFRLFDRKQGGLAVRLLGGQDELDDALVVPVELVGKRLSRLRAVHHFLDSDGHAHQVAHLDMPRVHAPIDAYLFREAP